VLVCLVAQLVAAVVSDSCSASPGTCAPHSDDDALEVMSLNDLEAAEEQEADMMRMELLQTPARLQVQRSASTDHARAPQVTSQEQEQEDPELTPSEPIVFISKLSNDVGDAEIKPEIAANLGDTELPGLSAVMSSQKLDSKILAKSLPSAAGPKVSGAGVAFSALLAKSLPSAAGPKVSGGGVAPAVDPIRKAGVAPPRPQSVEVVHADAPSVLPIRLLFSTSGAIALVFVAAIIAQALTCTDKFGPKRKYPKWTLPAPSTDATIRAYVRQLKVSSASDLEIASPNPEAASGKPAVSGRILWTGPQLVDRPSAVSGQPVRVEVKVENLMDRTTVKAPLTGQACVAYSAAAIVDGDSSPIAHSSKRADFIVAMVDAPWVKILVEGADVLCFGMKGGLWEHREKSVEKAPDHLKEFVAAGEIPKSDTSYGSIEQDPEKKGAAGSTRAVEFEESAVVIGSTITLVGKLCRGPGGQLSLQRWQKEAACHLPATSPKESCLTPCKGQYNAEASSELWEGKILICDDPTVLSRKA